MQIKTGIDIVNIREFNENIKRGKTCFLRRCFSSEEIKNLKPSHLAGLFAAKEAVIKAFSLPADSWLDIIITKNSNGRPQVKMISKYKPISSDLSISHTNKYAIACFVAILSN